MFDFLFHSDSWMRFSELVNRSIYSRCSLYHLDLFVSLYDQGHVDGTDSAKFKTDYQDVINILLFVILINSINTKWNNLSGESLMLGLCFSAARIRIILKIQKYKWLSNSNLLQKFY